MNHTEKINHFFYTILQDMGMNQSSAALLNMFILAIITSIGILSLLYLFKGIIITILKRMKSFNNLKIIKYLLDAKLPIAIALLFPYILLKIAIPIVFLNYSAFSDILIKGADIYLVCVIVNILISSIKAFFYFLEESSGFKGKPIKSYTQIISIIIWILGSIVIFSIATGKSPAAFFAAMGAASAVLMLIFKDTIMGFVASVQVNTNNMVRLGDWITMPKYAADGDVIDITLTTVKIQNFDKSITTVPTYSLISESFQNWRGMQEYGGRRIKRSIMIKQNSIRYITDEEVPKFKKIQGIAEYIDKKQAEISQHNLKIDADRSLPINGRNLTNGGLFRQYITWYLKNHPGINPDMTLMARQLPPTATGLPLELYTFTNTTKWVAHEEIMSDIFDHLIASVGYFDLEIFEYETGLDAIKSGHE